MGRWEPGARERLQHAALELIGEHGYDGTTVAGIAERAGLKERSFFRYFTDKREVLFAGQDEFVSLIVEALSRAPADLAPLTAVTTALLATTDWFADRRGPARVRQGIVDAHPDLRERELVKMAGLTASMARTLRDRGTAEPGATLAAEAGVAAFRVAFAQWVAEPETRDLGREIRSAIDDLRRVATA